MRKLIFASFLIIVMIAIGYSETSTITIVGSSQTVINPILSADTKEKSTVSKENKIYEKKLGSNEEKYPDFAFFEKDSERIKFSDQKIDLSFDKETYSLISVKAKETGREFLSSEKSALWKVTFRDGSGNVYEIDNIKLGNKSFEYQKGPESYEYRNWYPTKPEYTPEMRKDRVYGK